MMMMVRFVIGMIISFAVRVVFIVFILVMLVWSRGVLISGRIVMTRVVRAVAIPLVVAEQNKQKKRGPVKDSSK